MPNLKSVWGITLTILAILLGVKVGDKLISSFVSKQNATQ